MTATPYIALEMSLLQTAGPHYKVGWPFLYCWLKAVHLPGTPLNDARVSVLSRAHPTEPWHEFTRELSLGESEALVGSLEKLGIPGRSLDIEGVVDTSDEWSHVFFRVKTDEQTFALEIDMQASGFKGKDAEGLRALFRQLFDRAGYRDYCPVVYGQHPIA
jgi:hypothetical protein